MWEPRWARKGSGSGSRVLGSPPWGCADGGKWLGQGNSKSIVWQTQLQIQDLAIRCVQKNIKKNKGVKDWPWWKLFTTVRPLIQVQLSEEQIRNKDVGDLQSHLGPGRDSMYPRVLLVCLGLGCS